MTNEQAKKMLKAKLECLKRETSGTDFDCNNSNCGECSLCYEQGNMGEQKEALDMAIKALEEPERKKGHWQIYIISMLDGEGCKCSECGHEGVPYWDFCPNCGTEMDGEQDE